MAESASQDALDFAEQITRVLRAMEESRNFVAEQRKLMAEAAKFKRDQALAPWQVALAGMAAGAPFFGAGVAFVKRLSP